MRGAGDGAGSAALCPDLSRRAGPAATDTRAGPNAQLAPAPVESLRWLLLSVALAKSGDLPCPRQAAWQLLGSPLSASQRGALLLLGWNRGRWENGQSAHREKCSLVYMSRQTQSPQFGSLSAISPLLKEENRFHKCVSVPHTRQIVWRNDLWA